MLTLFFLCSLLKERLAVFHGWGKSLHLPKNL